MKIARNPETLHSPLAKYVHQIEVEGHYRWLNFSGQVGMDSDGRLPEDPMTQMALALENIEKNLKAANMNKCDLTKLTFYMVGHFDAQKRREIIAGFLEDADVCMTLIYVAGLANEAIKVEIDAWACQEIL